MPPSPTEAEVGGATETRPQWDMAGLTWPNLHGIERFSGPRAFSDKTGTVLAKPGEAGPSTGVQRKQGNPRRCCGERIMEEVWQNINN